jgi:hypothetical protein
MANIMRNARMRPIESLIQPQRTRPTPLKIAKIPTRPSAVALFTFKRSCAAGEAWEIKAMPAVTLSAKIAVIRYHWGVQRASASVYESVALTIPGAAGSKPTTA